MGPIPATAGITKGEISGTAGLAIGATYVVRRRTAAVAVGTTGVAYITACVAATGGA